ncbi:hypothetical protein LPB140_11895 [Sphingorhabdus lutea]|uniref:Uncharacterized protein n=1 Tax=Sphingorhabdus lutea TaxID=1913578 RepID=A0A1L3JE18_9SPHN|nr:hypothetical protein [Sphingorhabdus lutea]APG63372.1 hypothetical protein LPB140_11895 [Sphingorhabdus lutea]
MRKERIEATNKVAKSLWDAEQKIEDAIAAVAQLNAILPTARSMAKVSSIIGQDVFNASCTSLRNLIKARGNMVDTHHLLDGVKTDIGLKTYNAGGGFPKFPQTAMLNIVDNQAA